MTETPFDESSLMAELEQTIADLNAITAAFTMPEAEVTETDRRGVATATVSPHLAVTRISVQPTWEHTVTAAELPAALDDAIGRATMRAMGLDPDGEESPDSLSGAAPITGAVRAEAHRTVQQTEQRLLDQAATQGRDPRATEDHIDRLVAQMEAAISAAERAQAEGPLQDEPERLYSDNHMVSMASNGVSLMGTEINQNWLRGKSGTAVTQCLSEILDQAPRDQAAGFASLFRTAFGQA